MAKLSKNFNRSEFACGCGCGYDDISQSLVDKLQELRDLVGKPVIVTSGCRCHAYNRHIRGVINSPHLEGLAADIQVEGISPFTLAVIANRIDYIRIGIYPKHIHIDVKPANPSKYWLVKNNKYIYSGKEKDLNKFLKKNL
jgi:uncharacterized protein YcbK (DUF882 family)